MKASDRDLGIGPIDSNDRGRAASDLALNQRRVACEYVKRRRLDSIEDACRDFDELIEARNFARPCAKRPQHDDVCDRCLILPKQFLCPVAAVSSRTRILNPGSLGEFRNVE